MLFSSIPFISYFLPVFFAAYFALPWKNATLLVASLLFYASGEPVYILLLLFYIVANYTLGLAVERSSAVPGAGHRRILILGIVVNLGLLLVFKYSGFIATQVNHLAVALGPAGMRSLLPVPQLALPLGISFFTFQGISYLIDIHRGTVAPQRSLLNFAMYKAMFPQLIAGPIVRYRDIAAKVSRRPIGHTRIAFGIQLFVLGLAQKVLIANTVALPADDIFSLPANGLTSAAAWLGIYCYTLQIYFDFAGYSNMAIGLGHMMGFTYPPNFRRPYASRSVSEFWQRWHISLSSWFRDYLYVPLGGNRRGAWRTYRNLLIVFVLCGFWHGGAWNFVMWGLYYGLLLLIERAGLSRWLSGLWRPLRHAYLILAVMIGWVLFRADSLDHAGYFYAAMVGDALQSVPLNPFWRNWSTSLLVALVIGTVAAVMPPATPRRIGILLRRHTGWHACAVRNGLHLAYGLGAIALLMLSLVSLASGTYNPFIYFRF